MGNGRTEITTIFDADNHYWESSDAFTRYRDPKFAERGVQVKEIDGVAALRPRRRGLPVASRAR